MKLPTRVNKYTVTQQSTNDNIQDDYVTKCMGSFGYWQALICFVASAGRVIVPWNIVSIVYLTPSTEFSCIRFRNDTDIDKLLVKNSTCYSDCLEYEFNSLVLKENLITKFHLICENAWLKSFTQTAIMFGLLLGVIGGGWISDRYGRRNAYLLTAFIAVIFSIVSPFSPSYWIFTTLRVFIGIGIGGVMILSAIINIEIVGQKHREIVGALSILPDGIGQILLAIMAYQTSYWNKLLLSYGLISVVLLVMLVVIPDTPRWLVAHRKGDEAVALMTKVAKFNKLSTNHIKDTVNKAIEEMQSLQKDLKTYHMIDLFRTSHLRKITITSFVMWTAAGICFFGLNHYSTLLGSNIFIVVPLMGLLQIFGPILAVPVNKFLGRKVACFCVFCIVGTAMLTLVFIPDGHWGCSVTTGVGITFSIMLFSITYTQVNELYPTPLRNMGLGMSSAGAKVGAMISPFIANTRPHWVASSIFAAIPFVGAVCSLLLPETKGKKLQDIIE